MTERASLRWELVHAAGRVFPECCVVRARYDLAQHARQLGVRVPRSIRPRPWVRQERPEDERFSATASSPAR